MPFEAPGWLLPMSESGTLLNVAYDPGYTGKFIEIEVDPPVIQLPAEILGDGVSAIAPRARTSR